MTDQKSSPTLFKGLPRWIAILTMIAVVVAIVHYLAPVLIYIMLAVVVSLICRPIFDRLVKVHVGKHLLPKAVAALLSMASVYIVFLGLIAIFAPLIVKEVNALSQIDINNVISSLNVPLNNLSDKLAQYNITSPGDKSPSEVIQGEAARFLSLGNFSSFAHNLISIVGNILIAFVSVTFISFFFIKDEKLFVNVVLLLTPKDHIPKMKSILRNAYKLLSRYFIGLCVETLIITILGTIGLMIVGVKYAIIIALFAGITNIIPYLGPFMGTVFGIAIYITSNYMEDFNSVIIPKCIAIIVVFAITQFCDNYIFSPIIFARSVKSHPLEIFLVVLIAGTVGGVVGMIIAIPAYTMLRIVAKEFFSEFKIIQKLTEKI